MLPVVGSNDVVYGEGRFPQSTPRAGQTQPHWGRTVSQPRDPGDRVVTSAGGGQPGVLPLDNPDGRLVRNSNEPQVTSLCVTHS